jgi:hypothetical protein
MTTRTKLDIAWPESARERAKLYASKLIVKLQCMGYGVLDAPDYTKTYRHSIEFRGVLLGEVYVETKPSRRAGHDEDGVIFFTWLRRSNAHPIILNESSGDWDFVKTLETTVQRVDELLRKVLIVGQKQQAADTVEAAEIVEFQELQAELESAEAQRDAAWRELKEANAKIDVLVETLAATRRERDELRRWESAREKIAEQSRQFAETAEAERHSR